MLNISYTTFKLVYKSIIEMPHYPSEIEYSEKYYDEYY